jgi:hypothetical protein
MPDRETRVFQWAASGDANASDRIYRIRRIDRIEP